MSLGYATVELSSDERVIRPSTASGHVERNTMPGGRLLMTNKRLIWQPSWWSRKVLSSSTVELEVPEIKMVDIAARKPLQFVGGMRRRMRVHMTDGSQHDFMITLGGLKGYAAELRKAADEPRPAMSGQPTSKERSAAL